MSDIVNHPPHYNDHPSGVETIDIIEPLRCCLSNAVKYCWRTGKKGPELIDLEKACWYFKRAHAGIADETRPPEELLDRVLAHEPDGNLLGDVLRALFVFTNGLNYFARVAAARLRVVQEIERRTEEVNRG